MKTPLYSALAVSLLLIGCGQKSEPAANSATNAAAPGTSPLNAPADYLGAIVNTREKAIKVVDTANITQAIQLFNVEHGRNPKDLDELVTKKFLTSIPAAPYGMKIEYDAKTGTVKIVKQ